MKLRAALKQPAPRDSRRFIDRYLNEIIDYGGEPFTRAEAILHMQALGLSQPEIDRWLQGNELAQRRRFREQKISLTLHIATPDH